MATGSEIARLSVALDGDTSEFESALASVERGLNKAASVATSAGGAMGGALTAVSVAAGNLLSGAIEAAVNGLAGAFGALQAGMVGGNAEFERYETQFGVLLGSAQAARQRLEELAQFGASTPFELPEVVRADKILQAFGLHSLDTAKKFGMAGADIRTVAGDVAAGTGAKFEEIASYLGKFSSGATGEAIARMQELGITTRAELAGMGVAFSKSGEMTSPVAVGMSALLQVMQEKFGGMMDAQSSTFEGMASNLADWVGAASRTLGAPIFDSLKNQLGDLLKVLGSSQVSDALSSLASSLGLAFSQVAPLIAGAVAGIGPALSSLATNAENTVNTVMTAIDKLRSGFAAAGAGGAAFNILTMLGLDEGAAASVGAVLNNIISAVQGGINAIQAAAMAFQSGGVSGLLASLGLDPSLPAQVAAIMGQVASAMQTGLSIALVAFSLVGQAVQLALPALSTFATIAGSLAGGAMAALGTAASFVAQNWQVLASVLGAVGAVLAGGAILSGITALVGGIQFLIGVIGGITAVVSSAGGVFGLLATFISLPMVPIALLAAAIGFLAVAWATNLGNIQGQTSTYIQQIIANWQQLVGYVGAIQQFLSSPIDQMGAAWGTLTERIGQVNADFQNNLNSIAASAAETSNSASGSFETMAGNASTMGQLVQAVTSGNFGAIPGIVGGAMATANDNFGNAIGAMVANATNGANAIRGQLASIASMASAVGGVAADAMFGAALDQGQISGRTDPAAIAQKNTEFAQKTVQLAQSYQAVQAAFNKVTPAVGAAGAAGSGSSAAAKTAEQKIQEANSALQSTIKTVTDLNEMLKGGLAGLTVGDGADMIVQLAGQVAALGRRIAETFAAAMTGLSEDANKAASAGAQAIGSASGALGNLVGMLPKLVEFLHSEAWSEISAAPGAIVAAAAQIIAIGKQIADVFTAAMGSVSDETAKSAQNGAAVIGASSQALSSLVGMLPKLWEFINDPAFDEIMAARGLVVDAARKIIELGKEISDAFLDAVGNVSDETAKTAQNGAAVIGAATQSVNSLIDTIKKIADFTADVGYAAAIFTSQGRAQILSAASALITLGRDMFSIFSSVMGDVSTKAAASAKRAAEGLENMGKGLTAIIDSITKIMAYLHDGMSMIHTQTTQGRGAIVSMTQILASLGVLMLDQFAQAGATVSSLGVAAAKRLAEGLQAVGSGVASVIEAVVKLTAFMHSGMSLIHVGTTEGRGAIIRMAELLSTLGREVYNQFVIAAANVEALHVAATEALAKGVKAATDSLLATINFVTAATRMMQDAALRAVIMPGAARNALFDFARELSVVAREIYNQFVVVAANVESAHVAATEALAKGVAAATTSLTQTLDLVTRLYALMGNAALRAAVAPGAARAALFDLARDLAQFAREVYNQVVNAAVGIEEAHVGMAEALSKGAAAATSAIGSAIEALNALFKFAGDAVMVSIVKSVGARAWFAELAKNLAQFAVDVLTAFQTGNVAVSQDLIDRASDLGKGADAASQTITGAIGSLTALFKFAGDAALVAVVTSRSAREGLAQLGAAVGQFVEDLLEAFTNGGVAVEQAMVDSIKTLSDGAGAAHSLLSSAIDTIKLLLEPPAIPNVSEGSPLARFLTDLAGFARRVTEIAAGVAAGFALAEDAGLSPLAEAVGQAQTVFNTALDVIKLLLEPPRIPDVSRGSVLYQFLDRLARFAEDVTQIALTAVGTFTVAKDSGLNALSSAIGDALSVWDSALSVIKLLIEPPRIPEIGNALNPHSLAGFLWRLAEFAKAVTQIALNAVGAFQVAKDSGLSVLASAIGDALGVWDDALGVVKLLLEPPRIPGLGDALNPHSLAGFLFKLAEFAESVTQIALNAVGAFEVAKDSGLSTLAGVVGDALGVWGNALDIIKLLVEPSAIPDITKGTPLYKFLFDLAKFAADATQIALQAVGAFEVAKDSGLSALSGAIGDALSVWNNALDIIKLLVQPQAIPDISAGSTLQKYLSDLAVFAEKATVIAIKAIGSFTIAKDSGLSALAGAIGDALSVWNNALDIIKLLAEPPAIPDISQGSTLQKFLTDLAIFAEKATVIAIKAVGAFTIAKDSGLSVLAGVIGDALSIWQNALDIIKLLVKPVDIPDVSRGSTLYKFLFNLAAFAEDVTTIALQAVGAFAVAKDNGLGVLASAIGDALSVWGDALDVVKLIAKPTQPPDLGSGAGSIRQYLVDLTKFAQEVTEIARDAAAEFRIAENSGLSQLADAVGDALSVIGDALDLNKLKASIVGFTGFSDSVKGKIDLLFLNIIDIANQFAKKASDAGITDAFAEAGAKVASLFGDAVGALSDAIDLGRTLLDPATQIPSVAQVQTKLTAALNFMTAVLTQFSNAAVALAPTVDFDAIKTAADSAKSTFDVLMSAVETISTLREKHIGMDDFGEIRTLLTNLFGIFSEFAPDAAAIEMVSSAVSTALGGLANLVSSQSYAAGVSIGESIASGIVAGITGAASSIGTAVVNAVASGGTGNGGAATPAPAPVGNSGGTVIFNDNRNQSKTVNISQNISTNAAGARAAASEIYKYASTY